MNCFHLDRIGLLICAYAVMGVIAWGHASEDGMTLVRTSGAEIGEYEVIAPPGFDGFIDIQARTNLTLGEWELAAIGAIIDGSTNFLWRDDEVGLFDTRFFRAGEGTFDSDSDLLPDAQEVLLFGTDRFLADTDGDGRLDGDETEGDGTRGDSDGYRSNASRADRTDFLLPDFSVTPPTESLNGIPDYTPPVQGAPAADTPIIAEWSRQAEPGDTIVLTGEGLSDAVVMDPNGNEVEGRDTRFLVYAQQTNSFKIIQDAGIVRLVDQQCSLRIPESLPPNEMYLLWPFNAHGFGEPVAINRTEVWWSGFDEVARGDEFYMYGRNLTLGDDGLCYLYVEELDQWLTSVRANPYKAAFEMDVPLGTYTVYAHNGHGGRYGWSGPQTVVVKAHAIWGSQTVSVIDYGADGTDEADDLQAFKDAISAAGSRGTVEIPSGTYYFSDSIRFGDDRRIVGAGMDETILSTFAVEDEGSSPRLALAGNRVTVSNLTFRSEFIFADRVLVSVFGEESEFLNVRFDARNDQTIPRAGTPFRLTGSTRTLMRDCEIISDNALLIDGNRQIRIEDCDFIGIRDANQLITYKRVAFIDVNGCIARNYDESNLANGFGWCKGRWVTGLGASTDCYFEDNTVTNLLPRRPEPIAEFAKPLDVTPWEENEPPYEKGRQVLTLVEDIPDEFDGVLNAKVNNEGRVFHVARINVFSDDPDYPYGYLDEKYYYILELDAINNTLVIQVDNDKNDLEPDEYDFDFNITEIVDQNSGEQILFEGISTRFAGKAVEITPTTLRFEDSDNRLVNAEQNATMAHIVKGRGFGQFRRIESVDTDAKTVTLTEPWRIEPDGDSMIYLGGYLDRFAVYNNRFDGRPEGTDPAPNRHTASAGFEPYGGSSDMIVDSNLFSELRRGVAFISTSANDFRSSEATLTQSMFNLVQNNHFERCLNDLFMVNTTKSGTVTETSVSATCNIFRNNRHSGARGSAFFFENAVDPDNDFIKFNLFERNEISEVPGGIEETGGVGNQIWLGNSFSGTGSGNGHVIGADHVPVLRRSEWTGFDLNYSGSIPGDVLEVPFRVDEVLAEEQDFPLFNVGTEPLLWVALEATTWLTFTTNETAEAAEIRPDLFVSASGGIISNQNESARVSFQIDTNAATGVATVLLLANDQIKLLSVVAPDAADAEVKMAKSLQGTPDGSDIIQAQQDWVKNNPDILERVLKRKSSREMIRPSRHCVSDNSRLEAVLEFLEGREAWADNPCIDEVIDAFLERIDLSSSSKGRFVRQDFAKVIELWEDVGCSPDVAADTEALQVLYKFWTLVNVAPANDSFIKLSEPDDWPAFSGFWGSPANWNQCEDWITWKFWDVWLDYWSDESNWITQTDMTEFEASWKEYLSRRRFRRLMLVLEIWLNEGV